MRSPKRRYASLFKGTIFTGIVPGIIVGAALVVITVNRITGKG